MATIVGTFGNNPPEPPSLIGTNDESNTIYGDTDLTFAPPPLVSGNDILTGGSDTATSGESAVTNTLYGDAGEMASSLAGSPTGGDDTLTGGSDAFGSAPPLVELTYHSSRRMPNHGLSLFAGSSTR